MIYPGPGHREAVNCAGEMSHSVSHLWHNRPNGPEPNRTSRGKTSPSRTPPNCSRTPDKGEVTSSTLVSPTELPRSMSGVF